MWFGVVMDTVSDATKQSIYHKPVLFETIAFVNFGWN